jgi:hypothetical protein
MKNFVNIMGKKLFLLMLFALSFAMQVMSQPPPPPPGPDLPPGGGTSPIEGGLGYLVAFGIAYAFKKYKSIKKKLV